MDFMEFNDTETMFQWMEDQTNFANEHLAPEQAALTWGSTWVRFYDPPIVIFGKVLTEAEILASEGDDPEGRYVARQIAERLDRGYMFGDAFSLLEPEGEPGDTHRANAWPCSEALLNAAQDVGWNVVDLPTEFKTELQGIFTAWRTHEQSLRT